MIENIHVDNSLVYQFVLKIQSQRYSLFTTKLLPNFWCRVTQPFQLIWGNFIYLLNKKSTSHLGEWPLGNRVGIETKVVSSVRLFVVVFFFGPYQLFYSYGYYLLVFFLAVSCVLKCIPSPSSVYRSQVWKVIVGNFQQCISRQDLSVSNLQN